MAKTPAPAAAAPVYTGFAAHLSEFETEAAFLRSLYSRPTSIMDEHGNTVYPYGDVRVILPTARDVKAGLSATEPKERFPAVAPMDAAGNAAGDDLRAKIAAARGMTAGTAFTPYEVRLAIRRLGSPGVAFTAAFVSEATDGAADGAAALQGVVDALWADEDSLARALTRPIPAPVSPSEV